MPSKSSQAVGNIIHALQRFFVILAVPNLRLLVNLRTDLKRLFIFTQGSKVDGSVSIVRGFSFFQFVLKSQRTRVGGAEFLLIHIQDYFDDTIRVGTAPYSVVVPRQLVHRI